MADIHEEIEAFEKAVYGEDVRSAMVSLANKINDEVEDAVEHQLIEVDASLTQEGQGADAFATGIAIRQLQNSILGETARAESEEARIEALFVAPTQEAVDNWLDEHPEATTTVEDNSLTHQKLVKGTLGFVTPEMYGAVGDGSTNDRDAVQAALDSGYNVYLSRTYRIDDPGLILNASRVQVFGSGTLVKVESSAPHDKEHSYPTLKITSNNNVIKDITLVGDRDTGTMTEYRHGIKVIGNNVSLLNVTIKDMQGDGVCVGDNYALPTAVNVIIDGCRIDNVRRNGISIINSINFLIQNTIIENTHGTNPQAGIDIEPNLPKDSFVQKAIGTIRNVITKNNKRMGICVYDVNQGDINVDISDCLSIDDGNVDTEENIRGAYDFWQNDGSGIVTMHNCKAIGFKKYGLRISLLHTISGYLLVDGLSLINGNTTAAIRLVKNDSVTNDDDDLQRRVIIKDYYCAGCNNELVVDDMASPQISSANRFRSGTITSGIMVERDRIHRYEVTGDVLVKFLQGFKLALVSYCHTNSSSHKTFLVNGYGYGADRNTITVLDDSGSANITLTAVDGSSNFTLHPNSAHGYVTVFDMAGEFAGFETITE